MTALASALYHGGVRHVRHAPRAHRFQYGVSYFFLDLDEVSKVFAGRRVFTLDRPGLVAFRREDHLGDPRQPLREAVGDLVQERTGRRPPGPVRVLTLPRYLGCGFNPVSFYYVYDAAGERVECVVAHITNTPWRERHAYVLDRADSVADGSRLRFRFAKNFHVSPFLPMDMAYDWRFTSPGPSLAIHMENRREGRLVFEATMALRREEISAAALRRCLVRRPLQTVAVVAAIHWQALKLWLKRCPFHPHPKWREAPLGS